MKRTMRRIINITATALAALCIGACGAGGTEPASQTAEEKPAVENLGNGSALVSEMKDGVLIAPDGKEVQFIGQVSGDESGKIRLAKTESLIPTGDFAFDYYRNIFQGEDEIHAVIDTALGTTSSIRYEKGLLLIDTYKSVEGEEKDPSLLFTGELQGSYVLDAETGAEAVYE